MAKYSVTHSCGHEVEVQQFGPEAARREERAKMAQQPCLVCRNAAAAQRNAEAGLPALVGSPKQIAWAEMIRERILASYAPKIIRAESVHDTYSVSILRHERDEISAITKAGWWIDRRFNA